MTIEIFALRKLVGQMNRRDNSSPQPVAPTRFFL